MTNNTGNGAKMNIRDEIQKLVSLGPFPGEDSATEAHLEELEKAINKITPPVTREEAKLLMTMFGDPDTCFGLAWAGLHLIETAPGGPMLSEAPPSRRQRVDKAHVKTY